MNFFRIIPLILLSLPAFSNAQQHLIKLATIAPEGSSWTRALRDIDAEVRQRTNDAVGFKIYPGGVMGDEDVMLRKIRVGQLHAGGFGGQGASHVFHDLLALEMPFLFNNYEEIDYVLEKMENFYRQGYEKNGFIFLGWADIGFVHILSQSPVRGTADIKGVKVWRLEDEPLTEVLFRKAGVSSVPLIIPDVLLGLQTNMVEVVYAPPAAAIVMQWFTRVQYITKLPINYTLGALLISKRQFASLSPEQQVILEEVSRKHMQQQVIQSRLDNQEAFQVLQNQGLELVDPLQEEIQSFKDLVQESIPELVGKAFSKESFDLLLAHLAAFRQHPKSTDAP
jgi:TRAP-type C4-dicarboxylate transport system substrate-binding protein